MASEPSFEQPVPTPLQAWLGLRWSLLPNDAGIAVDMELRDDLRGPYGLLEGGVVTTLADVAGASAAARALGPWVATQAISMSFLAPGREGPIRAEGTLLRAGAQDAVCQVQIHDLGRDNRMIAAALVTVRSLSARQQGQ